MSFFTQPTHGFLKGLVNEDSLLLLDYEVQCFQRSTSYPAYADKIEHKIPSSLRMITPKLLGLVKNILETSSVDLKTIELHYMPPESAPIPLHQDNFYHCVEAGKGLKILLPLQRLSKKNGGLSFVNCTSSIGVLPHSPSKIPNFSSYIEQSDLPPNVLDDCTSYTYELGDCSYHLLNSLHFSYGNTTSIATSFLVYRFEDSNAAIDQRLVSEYKACYEMHSATIGEQI